MHIPDTFSRRFSDVTDTSATVHWTLPRTHVDSYRVTYVPIQGGKSSRLVADDVINEQISLEL